LVFIFWASKPASVRERSRDLYQREKTIARNRDRRRRRTRRRRSTEENLVLPLFEFLLVV
jgi:hypothetical protein